MNCLYHWENGKARQLLRRGDDFNFMKDKPSGKTRFILKEAMMDVRMRIPRPDGSVIFIQSFQDEDIEMANQAGKKGSMLAETSYLIRYESPSGKSSWTTIEKEKAHQMGEQTLIKSIIVNEDGSLAINFPTE